MAAAFLAVDSVSGRRVALKLPLPDNLAEESYKKLFQREQQAASALGRHANIVLFDSYATFTTPSGQQAPFLVLEYISGRSLANKIKTWRCLPQREVCRIGIEICEALSFIHPNFTHRDIKPENVLLDALDGEAVRVVDFGLTINTANLPDKTSELRGTLGYIAPERMKNPGDFRHSPAIDLFSLGCLLYFAATGQHAFTTYQQIFDDSYLPPSPLALNSRFNQHLSELIMTLISKQPHSRPSDATTVGIALTKTLNSLPFEKNADWPHLKNAAAVERVMALGSAELAPFATGVSDVITEELGLLERSRMSFRIHRRIRRFADAIQTGYLQEFARNDPEQTAKSVADALSELKLFRRELQEIAYDNANLRNFEAKVNTLANKLHELRQSLEAFLNENGFTFPIEENVHQNICISLNKNSLQELAKIFWTMWRELIAQERTLVADQLFVADLLTAASHRLELALQPGQGP